MRLARLLEDHRGNRTNADIARATGISSTQVGKILKGEGARVPYDSTLRALSVALEIPLRDVFDAAGKPVPRQTLVGAERLDDQGRREVQDLIFRLLDELEVRQQFRS